jgi:hypothetical protein
MLGLLHFVLAILVLPLRSKGRLEAENAVLRHQLIVLRRKLGGRVRLTNSESLDLYPDVFLVSFDPAGSHDHPSRNALALASAGLSPLLAVEAALAQMGA